MTHFTLHPTLAQDCIVVGNLSVCQLLLLNNSHFPWLVLVPKREAMRELFDLSADDYQAVLSEVRHVAQQLHAITNADKINIAALGNQVEQLHIHVIARFKHDIAWPKPVWSAVEPALLYDSESQKIVLDKLRPILD